MHHFEIGYSIKKDRILLPSIMKGVYYEFFISRNAKILFKE